MKKYLPTESAPFGHWAAAAISIAHKTAKHADVRMLQCFVQLMFGIRVGDTEKSSVAKLNRNHEDGEIWRASRLQLCNHDQQVDRTVQTFDHVPGAKLDTYASTLPLT